MFRNGSIAKFSGLILIIALVFQTSLASPSIWQVEDQSTARLQNRNQFERSFLVDDIALRRLLDLIPPEHQGQSLEIDLPMPDGSLARYQIFESTIMEPGLAAKFPHIKSYRVQGVDHPGASGRVDISSKGFRGMIDSPYGRLFIDPVQGQSIQYRSRVAEKAQHRHGFQCGVYDLPQNNQSSLRKAVQFSSVSNRISGSMLAYRLAVAATPEYVTAVGGTLDDAMSEINTAINRVNQIYERDLGIRLFLVSDNDELIDVQGDANFTNNNGFVLLDENQAWIDSEIGSDNYDIGHIFSTGGGGIARLQSVCGDDIKAQGVTGLPNPTGDIFYIDFVSHEIGHQFGGNHTFNGSERSCEFQRNGSTAFEPGSGSTIMAYAGICDAENLQNISEATFHAGTIAEIGVFVGGSGGACATTLDLTTSNSDPASVMAGDDVTIPVGTAFRLSGSASDADSSDVLSYQWDQLDPGSVATTAATFNSDQGNNPLFRSRVPQTSSDRHFPLLTNQLGLTSELGEILPTTSRTLNFRLTARDCRSGQGTDDVRVNVDAASGPFQITSHTTSSTFPATSMPEVTWSVNGTDTGAVNCANVDIDLLTFDATKSTFAVTSLITATANDGTEIVSIPDRANGQARFRVSCSDNIFYDLSDADLNITGTATFDTTGNTTELSAAAGCSAIDVDGAPPGTGSSGSNNNGEGGNGSILWELWMLGFVFLISVFQPQRRVIA